eukprot:9486399-Pyramimonas_sp.AAC.3
MGRVCTRFYQANITGTESNRSQLKLQQGTVAYPVFVGHPRVPAHVLTKVENGSGHVVVDGVYVTLGVSANLEFNLGDAGNSVRRLKAHTPQVLPGGQAQGGHLSAP